MQRNTLTRMEREQGEFNRSDTEGGRRHKRNGEE
jgi:hypothetical protein